MFYKEPQISIRFIDNKTDQTIAVEYVTAVPRVGDHVRLKYEKFFVVILVVWIYDEDASPYQRVNIGLEEWKDEIGNPK